MALRAPLPLLLTFSTAIILFSGCIAAAGEGAKTVIVVSGSRYAPARPGLEASALETAQYLCATRCNAISADYDSYMMSGWRLVRTAEGKEVTVPLDNPFIGGDCVCVGDEYLAELYRYPLGGVRLKN